MASSVRVEMPADFATVARGKTREWVEKHYGISNKLATRWRQATGLDGQRIHAKRPMPDDFHDVAPTMSIPACARHYRAHLVRCRQWYAETGIAPLYVGRQPLELRKPRAKAARPKLVQTYQAYTSEAPRDGSYEGRAAEHLRIAGYSNVHRCDENGQFALKGKFWRAGYCILTGEELVERARKKGWAAFGFPALVSDRAVARLAPSGFDRALGCGA